MDEPANTLTYSATDLPAGATFDPATREFRWTPTETQGPASYAVAFAVSDGTASDSEVVTITVGEVNVTPELAAIGAKSVAELTTLTFTVSASDVDEPANTLTYSATDLPAGATLIRRLGVPLDAGGNSRTGELRDDVRGERRDGIASEVVTITCGRGHAAPQLAAIGAKSMAELTTLTFTVSASDVDEPANTLTYSATDLPAGATSIRPLGSSVGRRRKLKDRGATR